jgi:hypothetical protein
MNNGLTEAQHEYIATKFKKFVNGGVNTMNVCEIEGEVFWVLFCPVLVDGGYEIPAAMMNILRRGGIEKFFAVNEKDASFGAWLKLSECVSSEQLQRPN